MLIYCIAFFLKKRNLLLNAWSNDEVVAVLVVFVVDDDDAIAVVVVLVVLVVVVVDAITSSLSHPSATWRNVYVQHPAAPAKRKLKYCYSRQFRQCAH